MRSRTWKRGSAAIRRRDSDRVRVHYGSAFLRTQDRLLVTQAGRIAKLERELADAHAKNRRLGRIVREREDRIAAINALARRHGYPEGWEPLLEWLDAALGGGGDKDSQSSRATRFPHPGENQQEAPD